MSEQTSASANQCADGATPRIWLILGDKPGDNAQVEVIAKQLGQPYETKTMLPKPEFVLGKPRFRISLDHLDLEKSDPLAPPWPDLILTIGRRPSMAALWVREQSDNHSKIVLLGRPKRWKERFALIIVPAQYCIPPSRNVVQLELPLLPRKDVEIANAVHKWKDRLNALPSPLTVLLVGGQTKPFRFDPLVAKKLLHKAVLAAGNGHLYISTSRRTPPEVVDALLESLPRNATLYQWSGNIENNPYLGLLGIADRFIVSGDSISMMVEIAHLGRPLAIFPLPIRHRKLGILKKKLITWLNTNGYWLGSVLYKSGLLGYSRDLTEIHQLLYRKGLATPLDEGFSTSTAWSPADEVGTIIERIHQLSAVHSAKA